MRQSTPDFRQRARLTELMDEPCSREYLRSYLRDLERVNRLLLAYRPTLAWLDGFQFPRNSEPLRILDVGCGYGDGLRRVERWLRARGIPAELTGIDLNPDAVALAAQASDGESRIRWVAADVFTFAMEKPAHIVVSALFTHHLADEEVVRFVQWMDANSELGWFVNDLSRAATPYHLFRWFARALRLHEGVQHDGPISVARSFVAADWQSYCSAAGLGAEDVEIRGHKPGRLCVSRRKAR